MRVEPQAHRVRLVPPDVDSAHAGNGLQALGKGLVGDARKLEQIPRVAVHGEHQDGEVVCIGLGHSRRVDVRGKVGQSAEHAIPDVVGSLLDVRGEVELDGDGAAPLAAHRSERSDPRDAVDGVLEGLGDLRFDDVCVGPTVAGAHRDDGRVDGRKLPNTQLPEADQPEQHDRDGHHDRQNRASDAQRVEAHGLAASSRIWSPGRKRGMAETMTRSPGARPLVTSTSSPVRRPVVTVRG